MRWLLFQNTAYVYSWFYGCNVVALSLGFELARPTATSSMQLLLFALILSKPYSLRPRVW